MSALSRNGEESEKPVLWPWPLTKDVVILWVLSGCQNTCSAKFRQAESSGSWVIVLTEKKNDENNTVHRYRAQSNNTAVASAGSKIGRYFMQLWEKIRDSLFTVLFLFVNSCHHVTSDWGAHHYHHLFSLRHRRHGNHFRLHPMWSILSALS